MLENKAKSTYKTPCWEGQVVEDNPYGPFVVHKVHNEKCFCSGWADTPVTIRFLNTGSERVLRALSLRGKNIKDLERPHIQGVGFIGSGPYKARKSVKEGGEKYKSYQVWENMLWRVYGKGHRLSNRYSGRNVEVCTEWHNFQNFCRWYLMNKPKGSGYALDSDLLSGQFKRKVYSPETSEFIPQELNKFFCAGNKCRGDYPVGVCKNGNSFVASVSCMGLESTRSFASQSQAFEWYKHVKEACLRDMARDMLERSMISRRIFNACMEWQAVPYPH